jgi:hypothetical protein
MPMDWIKANQQHSYYATHWLVFFALLQPFWKVTGDAAVKGNGVVGIQTFLSISVV